LIFFCILNPCRIIIHSELHPYIFPSNVFFYFYIPEGALVFQFKGWVEENYRLVRA
jgi:hypothetical protein